MTTHVVRDFAAASLRAHLVAAHERAYTHRAPVLASVVLRLPHMDPLAFFAAGAGSAQDRFFWSSPHSTASFAAVDAAWTFTSHGPGRVAAVARAWGSLAASIIVDGNATCEGAGPILLGGFSFDPDRPSTPLWRRAFPDGYHWVPRFLLASENGSTALTINVLVEPRMDIDRETAAALDRCHALLDAARTPVSPQTHQVFSFEDNMPARDWKAMVDAAVDDFGAWRLDKVVLARSVRVRTTQPIDASAVLDRLRAGYPGCFNFAIARGERTFLGASPEQLASVRDGRVSAMSLAGSIARGATPEEDRSLADALLASAKDQSEHAIVVRALHEALAGITEDLAPSGAPTVLQVHNVQHLLTTVAGRLTPGHSILDVVERLHPTPAVGGYPAGPALDLIRERENLDRGWYAGPIGWLNAEGEGEFAVALRSALIRGSQADLFAGCGIVAASDPESEYTESVLKLRPILSALEGSQQ